MTKIFDPTKPVQTRDGRPARILCTNVNRLLSKTLYPIVALVRDNDGYESIMSFTSEGCFNPHCSTNPFDLINLPEEHWIIWHMQENRPAHFGYNQGQSNNFPSYQEALTVMARKGLGIKNWKPVKVLVDDC